MRLFYPISIHAPTRGATNLLLLWPLPPEISIHAPTRGATQPYLHPVSLFRNFNPRSHEGSDDVTLKTPLLHSAISIHAPTRGATLQDCFEALLRIFQSTLPRGERLAVAGAFVKDLFISIHAPTRGATQSTPGNSNRSYNFNPRSHEGSDKLEASKRYFPE